MPRHRPLRILTWHVHGNYLYYLSQVPHEFWLVTDAQRSTHHTGRSGRLPWGDNVKEAPADRLAGMDFDLVLYQSRDAWDDDRQRLLSPAQRRLPAIYLEHDPPQGTPTDTRHWAADAANTLLVHCTPFNALMWDNGAGPVQVIEHGIQPLAQARYSGERAEGVVVVNNLARRGRRLGADVFDQVRQQLPLVLVGMNAQEAGGLGEIAHDELPGFMAQRRFFFNPIRYTSLGLSILEAMHAGVPIVGLATTELAAVLQDGRTGFIDTRVDRLVDAMHRLLADPGLAREVGEAGRRLAEERFNIHRFVKDWQQVLHSVAD